MAQVPGIRVFLQNPPAINVGGRITKSQYQYTLQGPISRRSTTARRRSRHGCATLPELQDVTSDLQIANPAGLRRRSTGTGPQRSASRVQQIEEALYDAYGSRQVSTIYTPTNQYWVMMELLPEFQRDLTALEPAISCARTAAAWCRWRGGAADRRRWARSP